MRASLWLGLSPLRAFIAFFFAIFIVSGCAYPTVEKTIFHQLHPSREQFRGRLALKIDRAAQDAELGVQPQFFSASFELAGTARQGGLILLSPLGPVVAKLDWSPVSATLLQGGKTQDFLSLEAMLKQVTGADIPLASLFAWLQGVDRATPGWQADLSQFAQGKLLARRVSPAPLLELRVVLED